MRQSEFETRVGMQVTPEEYSHIEVVYMNSDLEKDDFCAIWVKMNQKRVNNAKAERKAAEKEQAKRERLWKIVEKYMNVNWETSLKIAEDMFSATQLKVVESAGISLSEERVDGWTGLTVKDRKTISTVIYEIKKYLEVA